LFKKLLMRIFKFGSTLTLLTHIVREKPMLTLLMENKKLR